MILESEGRSIFHKSMTICSRSSYLSLTSSTIRTNYGHILNESTLPLPYIEYSIVESFCLIYITNSNLELVSCIVTIGLYTTLEMGCDNDSIVIIWRVIMEIDRGTSFLMNSKWSGNKFSTNISSTWRWKNLLIISSSSFSPKMVTHPNWYPKYATISFSLSTNINSLWMFIYPIDYGVLDFLFIHNGGDILSWMSLIINPTYLLSSIVEHNSWSPSGSTQCENVMSIKKLQKWKS